MSASVETAKVKFVAIVAAFELLDGLEEHLRVLGVSGYTVSTASGRGLHGVRRTGFLSLGNVRIETLMTPAAAQQLFEQLERVYAGRELIAFSHDVDAIPREHFV